MSKILRSEVLACESITFQAEEGVAVFSIGALTCRILDLENLKFFLGLCIEDINEHQDKLIKRKSSEEV